jgi:hypothetical protein
VAWALTIGEQQANSVQGRVPVGSQVVAEKSIQRSMQDEPDLVIHAIEGVVEFSQKLVTQCLRRTVIHAGPQQRRRISETF